MLDKLFLSRHNPPNPELFIQLFKDFKSGWKPRSYYVQKFNVHPSTVSNYQGWVIKDQKIIFKRLKHREKLRKLLR